MLEIKNLNISYENTHIIKDFKLSLPKGEIISIIGPSGIGKSTILKTLAGLKEPDSGTFEINNVSISKQKIGWIPQDYGLLPFKTVKKNILLSMKITNSFNDISQLISELSINNLMDKYPNQISGGQAQRVAIARAFCIDPDILLMDEPFSALDPLTRISVHNLFNEVWEKKKQTVILVTHDISEAINLSHKIVVLSKEGSIETIIDNPVSHIPFKNRRLSSESIELNQKIISLVENIWELE
ncbi:ABC transporter ATP-binding protein [Companilactobacillus sp. DQM5]|uniref:ABC transporter ATP-binding protein n=1 Tax=Companilactobacillus sp. DQM5 TaxID=3463359 RepID=UPI0040591C8C